MRRITELDAVRGLAAVIIVVYHLWFPETGFLGTAVDLFFVMSGFLITKIIIKQRERRGFLLNFFARRSLRIWPIYYLSLLAFLALNPSLPRPYPTDGLPLFLSYTQNVPELWGSANPPFAHGFFHTWSLAIEEQYYLIWPVALVILGRRALVPLALGLIALSVGTRMGGFSKFILLTRCDGLALGALLAAIIDAYEEGRASLATIRRGLIVIGLGSAAYLGLSGAGLRMLGSQGWGTLAPDVVSSLRMLATNLMFFGVTGMLVIESGHRRLSWLRDARLVELGQMSYGIYLYHYILFDIVQDYSVHYGLTNHWAVDAIKLAASFTLAAASWRLLERPLLSLKDRFGYREKLAIPESRTLADVARLNHLHPRA